MRPNGINRRFDGFLLRNKIHGVHSKHMRRRLVPSRAKLTIITTKDDYSVRQTVAVLMRLIVHNFVLDDRDVAPTLATLPNARTDCNAGSMAWRRRAYCCASLGGATRSRMGLGVTSQEAM